MKKQKFKPIRITGTITIGEREIHTDPHFDKQQKIRNCDINHIKQAITNPEVKIPSPKYSNANAYVRYSNGHDGIKVVVKDDEPPEILLTAYYI